VNGANGNTQQGVGQVTDQVTDFGQAADVSGIERAILGNLILYPKTRPMARSLLRPEYFYDSRHAVLFAEIQRVCEAGYADDDCQLVFLHLQKRGAMEKVGGWLYLMTHLDTYAGVPSTMSRHCQVLRQEARRRRQRDIGQRLVDLAGRLDIEPADLARQAVQDLQDPELSELAVDHGAPSAVAEEVIMSYEGAEVLARSGRECAGLDTGFHGLNRKPQLSDLRGSGGIEEHAVNVVLIHRPGFYEDLRKRYSHDPAGLEGLLRETTLLVEKCRFGPVGPVPLVWVPDRAVFAEPASAWRGDGEDHGAHDHCNN
jgi:replicative DNA helicase